jgi:hypothetical protein
VIDETDLGAQRLTFGQLLQQVRLGLRRELGDVGEVVMVDDDEDVVIGEVAADRVLDPVAAGVTAEQDDLEDAPVAKTRLGAQTDRIGEPGAHDIDHQRQFPALALG